jgi:calreticulin
LSCRSKNGKWTWGPGEWFSNEKEARGLITSEGMKFYSISAALPEAFSNKGKDLIVQVSSTLRTSPGIVDACSFLAIGVDGVLPRLVDGAVPCGSLCSVTSLVCLQFTAKYEKNEYSFCGGGYIKLLPKNTDLASFDGNSPYYVMFGPDRCGYEVSRIHAIFNHDGENLLKKDEVKLEYNDKNEFTHLYTLVVKADGTYDIQFDGVSKASGKLLDGWAFPSKTIDDPTDKKPSDWVDEAKIVDPNAVKVTDSVFARVPASDWRVDCCCLVFVMGSLLTGTMSPRRSRTPMRPSPTTGTRRTMGSGKLR